MIIWSCPVCKEWRIKHREWDAILISGDHVFCSKCMTPAKLYTLGADTLRELLSFIPRNVIV